MYEKAKGPEKKETTTEVVTYSNINDKANDIRKRQKGRRRGSQ